MSCPSGGVQTTGYSGGNEGSDPGAVNNGAKQGIENVGPIPVGTYHMGGVTTQKGPNTIPLTPLSGTNTFGRSGGFLIHGPNAKKDVNGAQNSSQGCIVIQQGPRAALAGVCSGRHALCSSISSTEVAMRTWPWQVAILFAAMSAVACSENGARVTVDKSSRLNSTVAASRPSFIDSLAVTLILGPARIPLDSNTTLADAQHILGNTKIRSSPDPRSTREEWACYFTQLRSAREYVVLKTDELGGPDQTIDGFSLSYARPESLEDRDCAQISDALGEIRTASGLRLGMSISELAAIVGKPRNISGDVYDFDRVFPIDSLRDSTLRQSFHPHYQKYDITIRLQVTIKDGLAIKIESWHYSTA